MQTELLIPAPRLVEQRPAQVKVGGIQVEANADERYKQGIVEGRAADIVYSNLFTGVHGNYLRGSITAAGLDPDNLPEGDFKTMDFGQGNNAKAKAWRDIWGSGQGIGAVERIEHVADRVDRLEQQYRAARARLGLG